LKGFAIFSNNQSLLFSSINKMKRSGFDGYLRLKKEYSFIKRGIQFNHVLSLQLLQLVYQQVSPDKLKIRQILRLLNKTLDVSSFKDAFASNQIVASYIIQRKDYLELMNAYFSGCNYQKVFLPSLIYKNKISPLNIISGLSFIFLRKHTGSLKEKLYLACYLIYYLNILDTLNETFGDIDLTDKKYIPFNSSFDMESLFVLYFRQKGVSTYHISHGLSYVKYDNTTGFDAVNGENMTAEKALVWGETSKTDLVNNYGRAPDAIIVAGNPKYPRKAINARTDFKNGIVFLGGPIYDKDNEELIVLITKIADKYGMNFTLKAHPSSNLTALADITSANGISLLSNQNTVAEILQSAEYDFAVAYNTTAYYEAMYYNMVCFRYAVNENGAFNGMDDKFYDEESFGKKIEQFKVADVQELNNKIEQVLTDNLGMGINRYEYIFNN